MDQAPARESLIRAVKREGIATSGLFGYFHDLCVWAGGPDAVVVEFGVRRAASTVAFLSSGARVHSYDLVARDKDKPRYREIRDAWGDRWSFTQADTLTVRIPECDILFVDDLHNYDHVRRELDLHAGSVRKCIVFHDTTTLGVYGQAAYDPITKKAHDGAGRADAPRLDVPGVRFAIDELLIGGEWRLARSEFGHNGAITVARGEFPFSLSGVYV